jgi:hypothetical protein
LLHGEDDAASFQFKDELLEGDERLALVELSERDALDAIVADHAAPERVVEVEDDAFRDQARGREHGVEQRLRQEGHMLQPARRLRHVPHPRVEPLRPPDRRGKKIDVVQEHIPRLARLDREPVVDLGENRADGIGDLELVIAERAFARQYECALNDRSLAVGSVHGPEVFEPRDCVIGERPPVARGVEAGLQLLARQQDDDILRVECVQTGVRIEYFQVDAVIVAFVYLRPDVIPGGYGSHDRSQMLGGAVGEERNTDDLGGARRFYRLRLFGQGEIIQRKHCVFHCVRPCRTP